MPVRLTVVYEFARVYASAQRKKYPQGCPRVTLSMPSPPKFNLKKVRKRKEEGSPRQKERDELLRSKEARMAAIRRANNIRRSVRNQIVSALVAAPAAPQVQLPPTRSP